MNLKGKIKKLLVENDLYTAPVNIVELAKTFGFTVFQQDIDYYGAALSNKEGFMIHNHPCHKAIVININQTPTRKRFIIAYELAYFISTLNTDKMDIYAHKTESLKTFNKNPEIYAMASEILMPHGLVRNALIHADTRYGLTPSQVYHIADLFNVSYDDAQMRLERLQNGKISIPYPYK